MERLYEFSIRSGVSYCPFADNSSVIIPSQKSRHTSCSKLVVIDFCFFFDLSLTGTDSCMFKVQLLFVYRYYTLYAL